VRHIAPFGAARSVGDGPERRSSSKLEDACAETQERAGELTTAAKQLERGAARLRDAAHVEDHGSIQRSTNELKEAASALQAPAYSAQLLRGFQEMHGRSIALPTNQGLRPDRLRLEERYEQFRRAVG